MAGSLDSVDKDSVLVATWPEAAEADCEHRHAVEPLPRSGGEVATAPFHAFPGLRTVEGLAQMPDGAFVYVVDRDQDVHLRFLLSEPG